MKNEDYKKTTIKSLLKTDTAIESDKGKTLQETEKLLIQLIKKANERQKKCIYQFAKAVIGAG